MHYIKISEAKGPSFSHFVFVISKGLLCFEMVGVLMFLFLVGS